ncbi:MAG: TRL domain-containing protein [Pseudomonadota bacterium]
MLACLRFGHLAAVGLLLAGCGKAVTPVAVLPPKPEHQGLEPTNVGIACAHKVLLIPFGDSHIREAKREGGIKDIATVEVFNNSFGLLGLELYTRQCTEVSGFP